MKKYKVPIQSLIDHIKTATDVDPWAKEMAEELLEKQEMKTATDIQLSKDGFIFGGCPKCKALITHSDHRNYCGYCGQEMNWE